MILFCEQKFKIPGCSRSRASQKSLNPLLPHPLLWINHRHTLRAVYKRVELCYTAGMKAYSQDLRQRVVRAVDAGQSQAEIAKTFAVSVATIKRYLKQRRETGHVLPKAIPGRPAKKGAVLQAHLRAQLGAHPDATRAERWRLFH